MSRHESVHRKVKDHVREGRASRRLGSERKVRGSLFQLGCLASEFLGSACLCSPTLGLPVYSAMLAFYVSVCGAGGVEFGFLCMPSKHSYRTSHLPGPLGSVFYYSRWLELEWSLHFQSKPRAVQQGEAESQWQNELDNSDV